ncbi:MAG: protein kinase [bacterium]|nr:protein kinase [bacterium]
MDTSTINMIFEFIGSDFRAITLLNDLGGQRDIYLAKKLDDFKKYVLKIGRHYDPTNIARMEKEITLFKRMQSDYFPQFYDSGFCSIDTICLFHEELSEDIVTNLEEKDEIIYPFFYTIEEYIRHLSWEEITNELQDEKKLLDFLVDMFQALNILWENRIVHRDLKPDNILVKEDFKPVVIDLGIAKSFREGTNNITHHLLEAPFTINYGAPEQHLNNKGDITYKSDQFAMGVILFHVLTGVYPYGDYHVIGKNQLVSNIHNGKIANFRNYNKKVSDDIVNFVYRLVEIRPHKRFRSGKIILNELERMRSNLK